MSHEVASYEVPHGLLEEERRWVSGGETRSGVQEILLSGTQDMCPWAQMMLFFFSKAAEEENECVWGTGPWTSMPQRDLLADFSAALYLHGEEIV